MDWALGNNTRCAQPRKQNKYAALFPRSAAPASNLSTYWRISEFGRARPEVIQVSFSSLKIASVGEIAVLFTCSGIHEWPRPVFHPGQHTGMLMRYETRKHPAGLGLRAPKGKQLRGSDQCPRGAIRTWSEFVLAAHPARVGEIAIGRKKDVLSLGVHRMMKALDRIGARSYAVQRGIQFAPWSQNQA